MVNYTTIYRAMQPPSLRLTPLHLTLLLRRGDLTAEKRKRKEHDVKKKKGVNPPRIITEIKYRKSSACSRFKQYRRNHLNINELKGFTAFCFGIYHRLLKAERLLDITYNN